MVKWINGQMGWQAALAEPFARSFSHLTIRRLDHLTLGNCTTSLVRVPMYIGILAP